MYKRDIYLDIDDNLNNYIKSVELDSDSRVWHFHLTVDYEPLDLTGKSVQFRAEKPDKTNVLNDCKIVDAEKGVVEVKLTRQVNAIPGCVKCLLKIIGDEGFVLKTKTFVVDVSKTLSDDAIVSSDEFGALEAALGKVQDIDNRFAQTNAQLSDVKHGVSVNKQFVNVLSLGVKDDASVDCTSIIHEAKKEYALFFPRGQYLIEYIELSSNDIIIGESESNTFLIPNHSSKKAFIYLEEGPVNKVKFENFTINKSPNNSQIGINLEANFPKTGYQHGGLWDSTIRNIYLTNAVPEHSWNGIGMKIVGSGDNALLPVQANIFERVNIFTNNVANRDNIPLIVEGQVEQNLFSRCSFSGMDIDKNLSNLENVSGLFRRRRSEDGSVDGDQGGGTNTFIQCYFGNSPTCLKFERSYNPTFINCYYENARRFVRIETVAKATIIGGAFLNVGGADNIIESDYSLCELYLTDSTLKGNVKCRGLNCSSKLLTNSMYDETATTSKIIEFVDEYAVVHCNHSNSSPIIDTLKLSDILNNHKEFYFKLVQKNEKTIKFTKNTGNIFNDLTIDISSSSPVIKATFIPYCNKYKLEVL